MASHQFMAFGMRGGEGGYNSLNSAAAEVAARAVAQGVTVSEYGAQQAQVEQEGANMRQAVRAAEASGAAALRSQIDARAA